MAAGIWAVAAEEAAGCPPPTPRSEAADARIAVPTTTAAKPTDSPAATRPFIGGLRTGPQPLTPRGGMVGPECEGVTCFVRLGAARRSRYARPVEWLERKRKLCDSRSE